MHTPRAVFAGIGCAALLAAAVFSSALADEQTDAAEKLQSVQDDIEQSRAQKAQYEKDVAELAERQREIQEQLVETAARLRALAEQIEDLETRLVTLRADEAVAAENLEAKTAHLAGALAAMQRLSRQPTAALILRPASIDDKARSALLLDAVMPTLADQAEDLRAQVRVVQALRMSIEDDQAALLAAEAEITAERATLAVLQAEKAAQQAELAEAIEWEQARLAKLAEEAESLEALLQKLAAEEELSRQGDFGAVGQPIDGLPFSRARGTLPLPVQGVIVHRFNQPDETGQPLKGIRVETPDGAQVISQWDGKVIFAGPFRDYGQLLIIAHGEGYHTLLAGMERLDVIVAQWLLAGEPVGTMRQGNIVQERAANVQNGAPNLYIELRQNGRSINPLPWLAAGERKVRG